jgi:hypothetical protein
MKYFMTKWDHSSDDAPVMLFHEVDENEEETRKIEHFRNGTIGYADQNTSVRGIELSWEPIPSFEEIKENDVFDEFELELITPERFEELWHEAILANTP